jgi:hypothetical protein
MLASAMLFNRSCPVLVRHHVFSLRSALKERSHFYDDIQLDWCLDTMLKYILVVSINRVKISVGPSATIGKIDPGSAKLHQT